MPNRQCSSVKRGVQCQDWGRHDGKHWAWVNRKLVEWLVGDK